MAEKYNKPGMEQTTRRPYRICDWGTDDEGCCRDGTKDVWSGSGFRGTYCEEHAARTVVWLGRLKQASADTEPTS